MARLSHRNVIAVYDVAEQDGRTYLTMELVRGIDLGERGSTSRASGARSWRCFARSRRGLARGARGRHRPPRRQAGEHPRRRRRRGPGRGLRRRAREPRPARDPAATPTRDHRGRDRHARVHGARAAPRRAGRCALRSVRVVRRRCTRRCTVGGRSAARPSRSSSRRSSRARRRPCATCRAGCTPRSSAACGRSRAAVSIDARGPRRARGSAAAALARDRGRARGRGRRCIGPRTDAVVAPRRAGMPGSGAASRGRLGCEGRAAWPRCLRRGEAWLCGGGVAMDRARARPARAAMGGGRDHRVPRERCTRAGVPRRASPTARRDRRTPRRGSDDRRACADGAGGAAGHRGLCAGRVPAGRLVHGEPRTRARTRGSRHRGDRGRFSHRPIGRSRWGARRAITRSSSRPLSSTLDSSSRSVTRRSRRPSSVR